MRSELQGLHPAISLHENDDFQLLKRGILMRSYEKQSRHVKTIATEPRGLPFRVCHMGF